MGLAVSTAGRQLPAPGGSPFDASTSKGDRVIRVLRSSLAPWVSMIALVWAPTPPASAPISGPAHVALSRAEPGIDTTITDSPAHLRLWFSERISLSATTVEIRGPRKPAPALSSPRIDRVAGDPVTVDIRGVLQPGVYRVRWQTVAEDGDPGEGTYRFTLAAPAPR